MKDAKRASKTFDEIADHFDKTRYRPWDEVVEFLQSINGKIIDLGCGNGRHSLEAKELGLEFICLDVSRKLLDIAKDKTGNDGEYVRSGLKRLPFKSNTFDNALFIAAIHHLSQGRVESLKESKRILKEGGRIMISSWSREQERWDLDEDESETFVPWHKRNGSIVSRYYYLYRLDELADDVKESGLKILKKFKSEGNNYIVAEKI
ncbi:MAG: class I SAM-dependent methyltransferase [Candidatus Saliniplasma sp.]